MRANKRFASRTASRFCFVLLIQYHATRRLHLFSIHWLPRLHAIRGSPWFLSEILRPARFEPALSISSMLFSAHWRIWESSEHYLALLRLLLLLLLFLSEILRPARFELALFIRSMLFPVHWRIRESSEHHPALLRLLLWLLLLISFSLVNCAHLRSRRVKDETLDDFPHGFPHKNSFDSFFI